MQLRSFLLATSCLLITSCTTKEYLDLNLPEGFTAELVYCPSEHGQGSWVCLTTDNQGRLIASDQYGKLYRITTHKRGEIMKVDSISLNIGRAQGLLWAFNSLYVSVNNFDTDAGPESGVYRLTDSDGDDQLDHITKLVALDGAGEHGPHSLVLGPDKKIYLIAGNHTDIPDHFKSFSAPVWQEDRLMPAVKDPRGHANERGAPGGWIARTDSLGQSWEVIATGFRNAYDMAFDDQGELFTFDSDMEWDLGTPWYRPTRICHVIPGAEFGWRTGSAKWPDYYTDNLPAVLPMGQGSPTGVAHGSHSNFPQKYREGLFVLDWSFGTMYFIAMAPEGATFTGQKELFLAGSPLPLTDVAFGGDGAMYFTTGGRKSASGLYKVSYRGKTGSHKVVTESTSVAKLRRQLTLVSDGDPAHLDQIWEGLNHHDRQVRYAARIALEHQPLAEWKDRIGSSPADACLQSCIALTRTGTSEERALVLDALGSLDLSHLEPRQQLDLLRAYSLLFSRWGVPEDLILTNLPEFPSGDAAMDRELCDLLAFLQDPQIVSKTVPLMQASQTTLEAELIDQSTLERSEQYGPVIAAMRENRPLEQSMAYALSLTHTTEGWTDDLRTRYFKWFYQSLSKSGGESYKGFLERIRLKALAQVPEDKRQLLAELSGELLLSSTPEPSAQVQPPKGPGRVWEVGEANALISENLHHRSFEQGQQMYQALLCGKCHSMQGQGGNTGPDLTQVSTRFSVWDMLQSLQTPSLAISDQYAGTLFTLEDGSTLVGRTVHSTEDSLFVNVNPYDPSSTRPLARSQITAEQLSPVSLMPAGLINALNEQELLDLMAYLKSGGDPDHEVFGN